MWIALLEHPLRAELDLHALDKGLAAGALCPPEVMRRLLEWLPGIGIGYGMTETAPVIMANPLNGNARHVSVGVPMPGTLARIVSETDPSQPVEVGQAGGDLPGQDRLPDAADTVHHHDGQSGSGQLGRPAAPFGGPDGQGGERVRPGFSRLGVPPVGSQPDDLGAGPVGRVPAPGRRQFVRIGRGIGICSRFAR